MESREDMKGRDQCLATGRRSVNEPELSASALGCQPDDERRRNECGIALGRWSADEPEVVPQLESSDQPRRPTSQPKKNEVVLWVSRETDSASSSNRNCRTTSATRRRRMRIACNFPGQKKKRDGTYLENAGRIR